MAKKDDPLVWVFFIIFMFPIAIIWLLKVCIEGIAALVGTVSGAANSKKRVTIRKRGSNYTKPRTTRSTATTRSADFLSTPQISSSTTKTQSTYSAPKTAYPQVSTHTTKQISLYEALRLPGDPDPEFGGCSIYVNTNDTFNPSHKEKVFEFNYDDEFIDEIEDIEEEDNE